MLYVIFLRVSFGYDQPSNSQESLGLDICHRPSLRFVGRYLHTYVCTSLLMMFGLKFS